MTKRRKVLSAVAAAVLIFGVGAFAVIHNPGLQHRVWEKAARSIETHSGFEVDADEIEFRLFPGRFAARRLKVSTAGEPFVTVAAIEISWKWRHVVRTPRRLERVFIDTPVVHGDAWRPSPGEGESQSEFDFWGAVEIDALEIAHGSVSASAPEIGVVVEKVALRADVMNGRATADLDIADISFNRSGRVLALGPMSLRGEASNRGIEIRSLDLEGEGAGLSIVGSVAVAPEIAGTLTVELVVDLPVVGAWWDPNLVTGLAPVGRLQLGGAVELIADGGVAVELDHHGPPISVAGYGVDGLKLSYSDGRPSLWAEGADWGRATVVANPSNAISVAATLDDAPVDELLAFVAPSVASAVRGPTALTGTVEVDFSFPIDIASLVGDVDLMARWSGGRASLRGRGAGAQWAIDDFTVTAAGIEAAGSGAVELGGPVRGAANLAITDPEATSAILQGVAPVISDLGIGGGPIEGRLRIAGTFDEPVLEAEALWTRPSISGRDLESLSVEAEGSLEDLIWHTEISVGSGAKLEARGHADGLDGEINGRWNLVLPDLEKTLEILAADIDLAVEGMITGSGSLELSTRGYLLNGRIDGRELMAEGVSLPSIGADFDVDPSALTIEDAFAEVFGGRIEGRMYVEIADLDGALDAAVSWRNIDIGALQLTVPEQAVGRVAGHATVSGSLARPEIEVESTWSATGSEPLVEHLRFQITLAEGVATAGLAETDTGFGVLGAGAEVPLGDLPRPEWLWPNAPGGPVSARFVARGFRSGPVAQAIAVDTLGAELKADIQADIEWNPAAPDRPRIEAVATGLQVVHPAGELVADGPLEILLDDQGVRIEPVVLTGFESRLEVELALDSAAGVAEGFLDLQISEKLADLVPLPASIRGPMRVQADLQLPASKTPSFESITGTFSIDHGDGMLVMRDPPFEVRGLQISGEIRDGRIDLVDGSAEVNRGTVEMGGSWNPETGQGLVFELDDVMVFVEGILTRWDGNLAVEPREGKMAHVGGDLTLVVGLWDETFDVASAVLGPGDIELEADDPLHEISLDVAVRGRTGIRVDNNLGRFDVTWDVLRVDGTAASPRLQGEVRIAPGGIIGLGGRDVKVRRGTLEFTGDRAVDPIVEIVPESDMTLIGSGKDGGTDLDASLMATRGLAQGISSVLGFENETLRPAEIAVQTERDPSVNFMVGQRLSRNLALFLTTNLTDVQDRTTMIQAWNFRGLKGLVAQVYQETFDDSYGGNILQRFSWGGTARSLSRPEIHRIRLEGDWPMSKRYLRSATRLRKGQPFDPFLLFVASVRMERALAENGYQKARVASFQEGDSRSPTLVFFCDPGRPQFFRFSGDSIHRTHRAEATAMYQPPPLEGSSLRAIEDHLTLSLALEGFPDAEVEAERRQDAIEVMVDRHQEVKMTGPVFDGLPADIGAELSSRLGSATALAVLARNPGRVESSVEQRLTALGYLEAEVRSVEVQRLDVSSAEIRIAVDPGQRETIDEVVLRGDDPLQLFGTAPFVVSAGQPLDRPRVEATVRSLRDEYVEAGYREASARSDFSRLADGRWVATIDFEAGPIRRLRNVEYSGLRHTSPKVLAKGLELPDGAVLTDLEIDRSAAKMANFSPIEKIEVRLEDVGVSDVDVEFDVTEKDRWAADIGGGWSTERGLSTSFGFRDDNLFGRGIGLNLRGGWGSTEKRIFLIGSVPPVPGGRLSLISTIGHVRGDAPDEPDLLEQEESLASLEAQYALVDRVQVGVYYRWTNTRTFEKDPDPFFPLDVRLKVGTVGLRTVVDRFDNLFDPRRGFALTSDVGWSSNAFGSDLDYISWLSNFSLALAPFSGSTWLQTARVGVAEPLAGQRLVRNARFFAGGQASVRGFDLNSVGPVTFGIDGSLVPAGGGALFILNEEIRIPIRGPLRAAVFADIGQVWETWNQADFDLSIGVGVGVRWSTPIGPLWADVAWPVANIGISSTKPKFYLGIGRPF